MQHMSIYGQSLTVQCVFCHYTNYLELLQFMIVCACVGMLIYMSESERERRVGRERGWGSGGREGDSGKRERE